MDELEHRVRTIAYRLWEEAGRPPGRADEFWHAAVKWLKTHSPVPPQVPAAAPPVAVAARPARPAKAAQAKANRKPARKAGAKRGAPPKT